MSFKKLICIGVVVFFVSGCSQRADSISPSYVSPLTFKSCSCKEIRGEMSRVHKRVIEVTGQQNFAANKDGVALTVGLILFWPALFFMIGGDKKEELSRLKGEYEALETVAIKKDCDVGRELQIAREERGDMKTMSLEEREYKKLMSN